MLIVVTTPDILHCLPGASLLPFRDMRADSGISPLVPVSRATFSPQEVLSKCLFGGWISCLPFRPLPSSYLNSCVIEKTRNLTGRPLFFLLFFCYDFSFVSIVVREHPMYVFSPFKCVEVCFMAQHVICFDEYSLGTWKKKVYSAIVGWDVPFYVYELSPPDCVVQITYVLDAFLSSRSIGC